jgi:CHASE3 domain sensor protein
MKTIIIFLLLVIGTLIGTTIYYSNKATNDEIKNEQYKNDIEVLQKDLSVSEDLIKGYIVIDSLKTSMIDTLNVKYNNAVKDEEIKKKYDKIFDDIDNASWSELDSVLTRYGII